MDIAIAFDQNYLRPFYALITSIFDQHKLNKISIHAIVSGVSEEELVKIKQFCLSNNAEFQTYKIDFELTSKFVLSNKWTQAVYYRLFFPMLVPSTVEKLLYLDTDIIVIGKLNELFNKNLYNYPVAAVYDNYVKKQELIGIHEEGKYFNSGVLLMNVKEWNKQEITEQAIRYLNQYPERIKFVDQCALNAVLKGKWLSIETKYNTMYSYLPFWEEGFSLFKKSILNVSIIHFTLHRPWNMLCKNRARIYYEQYLYMSPSSNKKIWTDFSVIKIFPFFKQRFFEFYFDNLYIQKIFKLLK